MKPMMNSTASSIIDFMFGADFNACLDIYKVPDVTQTTETTCFQKEIIPDLYQITDSNYNQGNYSRASSKIETFSNEYTSRFDKFSQIANKYAINQRNISKKRPRDLDLKTKKAR